MTTTILCKECHGILWTNLLPRSVPINLVRYTKGLVCPRTELLSLRVIVKLSGMKAFFFFLVNTQNTAARVVGHIFQSFFKQIREWWWWCDNWRWGGQSWRNNHRWKRKEKGEKTSDENVSQWKCQHVRHLRVTLVLTLQFFSEIRLVPRWKSSLYSVWILWPR